MQEANPQSEREQAHLLLDVLPEEKVSAAASFLETMIDPVSLALANAPYDDEPVSAEEALGTASSRASLARGEYVSNDEVLVEFGLTPDDFEQMGRTPIELKPRPSDQ